MNYDDWKLDEPQPMDYGLCERCQMARANHSRGIGRDHEVLCNRCVEAYDEELKAIHEQEERDPDAEREDREERKRIAAEMDGPHEEGL